MALDTWLDGVLVGKHTAKRKARWIVEQPDGIRNESSECQVRVEPEEKPAHCPACKLETKGCTWCSDPKPGCIMPNKPPKQVRVEPKATGKDCLQVEANKKIKGVPDGLEFVRYGKPSPGDMWLEDGCLYVGENFPNVDRLIVRKTKPKTPIMPAQTESVVEKNDRWLPMDSAPKDGTDVQVLMGGIALTAYYTGRIWISIASGKSHKWDEANQPTAWREL
jgi:hypothetical protein